jgi:hypothetical protein
MRPAIPERTVSALVALCIFSAGAATVEAADIVTLQVGHAQTLKLSAPAHTVAVGDADVASASVAFGDTLMLIGRNPGTTNLVVLDAEGSEIENTTIRVVRADGRRIIEVLRAGSRRTYLCGSEPVCLFVDPATRAVELEQTDDPAMGRVMLRGSGDSRSR